MKIVTLTVNPTIDITIEIDQLIPGAKLRARGLTYEPGGGGINVSRVISELGGDSRAVFTAGGSTGEMLRQLLDNKNISLKCIDIQGRTRENITVVESSSGQLYRMVMPGPRLSPQEQDTCLDIAAGLTEPAPDYMVISGSLPEGTPVDLYTRIIHRMKAHSTKIILDTKADTLKDAAAEGVFLLKPNLRELAELAGQDLENEKMQEQQACELIDRGLAEVIVLSLGPFGVLLAAKDICERIRAPHVPIQSRVGAGDSMVAGLTLALTRGQPLSQAVRFGIAAGSAAVMTPGTRLCRREDVERLFAEMH